MDPSEVTRWTRATELFERVVDLPPERRAGAAAELGEAHGVRSELIALLAGLDRTSVLDSSLHEALHDLPHGIPSRNALRGLVLGSWRVGEEIGRGGMSVVYHAERVGQDFQQRAALKILSVEHLGDTFVDGFVRERQFLSDFSHPGIARLIDGGITPSGSPFLVMEHVQGERIDRWCEQHCAENRDVVQLMVKLCDAVAYAQRHLVVHQDIKPGNVLVDERGQPVLIDFGIARLLKQTADVDASPVYTPGYAAPEQRKGRGITTATDVYALGVVLRHLLENRSPDRDLQAIVEMATQGDPDQRYANARVLADDLQAWLEQRPVRARPRSASYRAERFIRRNVWGVAATTLVGASLVIGLAVAWWQANVAATERDIARAEKLRATQVVAFLENLFSASDPDHSRGEDVTARELLDLGAHQVRSAMSDVPDLKAEILVLVGDLYREIGEFEAAAALLEEALMLADSGHDEGVRVAARRALAQQRMEAGAHAEALALAEEAETMLARANRVPGVEHADLVHPILFSLTESGRVAEAAERGIAILDRARADPALTPAARYKYLHAVATALLIAERENDAESLLREAMALDHHEVISASDWIRLYSDLAGALVDKGDYEAARENYGRALALAEELYPPAHSVRARQLSNIGGVETRLGRLDRAEQALRVSLSIYEQLYADRAHPRVAAAHNNLASVLEESGRYQAAIPHQIRARALAEQVFGADDPRYAIATANLGVIYRKSGDLARAETHLHEAIALQEQLFGQEHRRVGMSQSLLAVVRLEQGRFDEALQLTAEALALFDRLGFDHPAAIVAALTRHAQALAGLERPAEARETFNRALVIAAESGDGVGVKLPELLRAHAEFLVMRSDPEAPRAVAEALAVHKDLLGEAHPDTMRVNALLAN